MKRLLVGSSLLFGLTATGCMHAAMAGGHAAAGTAQPTAASGAASPQQGACPMDVPGTQLAFAELPDGAAVTFTTTPDQADLLRGRVRAMADMHNTHHADAAATGNGGATMGGHMGMHHHMGDMSGMQMPPPSRATVEDVPNGARLVVTPNDPADLAKLRSTVRAHAEEMQQHGCGGMREGGHAGHGG